MLVVNVPDETVMELLDVNAPTSDAVRDCDVLPIVIAPKVLPAGVMETAPDAARNCSDPECVHVIPDTAVKEPFMLSPPVPAKVPVNPVKFKSRQFAAPVFVTVTAPEAAVKNTLSAEEGTASPPVPPSVNAHLVPAVESHAAVPPTQ